MSHPYSYGTFPYCAYLYSTRTTCTREEDPPNSNFHPCFSRLHFNFHPPQPQPHPTQIHNGSRGGPGGGSAGGLLVAADRPIVAGGYGHQRSCSLPSSCFVFSTLMRQGTLPAFVSQVRSMRKAGGGKSDSNFAFVSSLFCCRSWRAVCLSFEGFGLILAQEVERVKQMLEDLRRELVRERFQGRAIKLRSTVEMVLLVLTLLSFLTFCVLLLDVCSNRRN